MNYRLEDQLLHASLLCGLLPDGKPAYRLQLFFTANREIPSKSHQSDFQRALETGVDSKGLWENFGYKGSGEYLITEHGYRTAAEICPVQPIHQPIRADQFRSQAIGTINKLPVEIRTFGRKSEVFIRSNKCRSAKEACQIIERETNLHLPTTGESAVRVLYDMAIDQGFELILG